MAKKFNVTGVCISELHYMINLSSRLEKIKAMVDQGLYFTINRARQYGKTTTLRALSRHLQEDYYVVSMDFQTFGSAEFAHENRFALSFAETFVQMLKRCRLPGSTELQKAADELKQQTEQRSSHFALKALFIRLSEICAVSEKPIVLIIDETDSGADHPVFLDFLAQLRAYYMDREQQAAFHCVILSRVYDIRNLRRKLRPDI